MNRRRHNVVGCVFTLPPLCPMGVFLLPQVRLSSHDAAAIDKRFGDVKQLHLIDYKRLYAALGVEAPAGYQVRA